jgi:hypothetical protein
MQVDMYTHMLMAIPACMQDGFRDMRQHSR